MAAASGYELLKLVSNDASRQMLLDNMNILLVGIVVAFVVAMFAIKFFINFLTKYGFKAFGYYRIFAGLLILILLLVGYNLEIA
jgi:undecaprenyl-diphosphatase